MFNIFKNKSTQEVGVKEYPAVVKQIHHEFETAGERLFKEAEAIINGTNIEGKQEKVALLAKLGFKQTEEYQKWQTEKQQLDNNQELVDLIQYYHIHYPNNKFITKNQVTQICDKYNLVCGSVELYKGFVPETKLKSMADFNLNLKEKLYLDSDYFRSYQDGDMWFDFKRSVIDGVEYEKEQASRNTNSYRYTHYQCINDKFEICAPIKDMDMKNHTLKGRFLVKNIPDPVVLQRVSGGYLIITAWGDEASDELVVNNKMN